MYTFVPLKMGTMASLKDKIDLNRLPRHIAIIMDGNGRWAREQGQDRLFGHYHGVESVRNIVYSAAPDTKALLKVNGELGPTRK